MVWDGREPRAVVPPPHLQRSRDVVCPRPVDMASSPFPLGIGVSITASASSSSRSRSKALPLYYVSEQVAIERSPCSHPRNPSGVLPGWYLLAQPNMQFEVVMTKVNGVLPGKGGENQFSSGLFVDGVYTHQKASFYQRKPVGIQFRAKGFVKERRKDSVGNREKIVNGFAFRESMKTADDDLDNSDVGTIRADFVVERRLTRNDYHEENFYQYRPDTAVSERDAVKYGKSLMVSAEGPKSVVSSRASQYMPTDSRTVPEGAICIYVREAAWMKSRRLIDAAGNPCTYQTFVTLLAQEDRPDPRPGQRPGHGDTAGGSGRAEARNRASRLAARNVRGWLMSARQLQFRQNEPREGGRGRGARPAG